MQVVIDNADLIWIGLKLTLKLSVVIILLATLVGTFVGIGLVYGNWLVRSTLRLYVDIIRGIPLLVLIFLIFYGLPALHVSILGHTVGGLAVLLWAMMLGMYKPRGLTPYGRRNPAA